MNMYLYVLKGEYRFLYLRVKMPAAWTPIIIEELRSCLALINSFKYYCGPG